MGRLFWKIFLVILLAQLVTANVVGILLWWHDPRPRFIPQAESGWQQPTRPPGISMPEEMRLRPPMPPPDFQRFPEPRGFPFLPTIVGCIASLVFAAILARNLSRPIMALRRAFSSVAQGNFDIHPVAEIGRRSDELAELGADFEQTARQLKAVISSQRRLLHDVSHEVRSPLARMQLAIDLARQQPEKTATSMQRIERESARIDRLVEELLTLSRLESRSGNAQDEEVEIGELLTGIVEDARFEARTRRCNVEFTAPAGPVFVNGRGELLQRAIENVVRNALRHTFENTAIRVGLRLDDSSLWIEVEDDGPGLPESALDSIFEPFVRFREDRGNDGYGLGLAITRHAIEAHGGSVRARNREHGGLCVEICLPRLNTPQA